MKAAYITETGPAENIQYGDIDKPQPGDNQVLVKMTAVALNPVDTYIRNGANYWELPQPFIVGCDMAGEVEAVGSAVTRFQSGQRVWCTNQGLMGRQGTFAEYCAIDEHWLYATPDGVADEDVAACALVGVTAHLGLFRDAQLQQGESIFVHGGTGGVGSMVVQMAKAAGARVIGTGGSDEKVAACKQLGADAAVNYKTEDVGEAVSAFAPDGVNVFWETLREPDFDTIVSYLAERGRLVLMAGRDARPEFPVGPFYVKGCSIHGFVMFKATPAELQVCAEDMNTWLSEGKLKANISHRLPLSEAAKAHQLQEENTLGMQGTIAGKIVLTP
jgi:NADPH2:quinone reductase